MNKYAKEYKQYYPKVFISSIVFIVMSIYLINRSDKPREEFLHLNGTISYVSQTNPLKPDKGSMPKHIFLVVNEYNRVFEMFTGNDKGDFSPRVNKLQKLKVGDEIDIYFEENNKTEADPVNRLIQYLDKDGELLYLRSKADKYIGYFLLLISAVLILSGIYMKKKSE